MEKQNKAFDGLPSILSFVATFLLMIRVFNAWHKRGLADGDERALLYSHEDCDDIFTRVNCMLFIGVYPIAFIIFMWV